MFCAIKCSWRNEVIFDWSFVYPPSEENANVAEFNEFSYFVFAVFVLMFFTSTTEAIKCYVCGEHEAELQLFEAKLSNYNESVIKQKIHTSCDEFDRINLEEKHNYEHTCPEDFAGCLLKVGSMKFFYCRW